MKSLGVFDLIRGRNKPAILERGFPVQWLAGHYASRVRQRGLEENRHRYGMVFDEGKRCHRINVSYPVRSRQLRTVLGAIACLGGLWLMVFGGKRRQRKVLPNSPLQRTGARDAGLDR